MADDAWGNCTPDSFKGPEDAEQEAYIRRLEARLQRVRGAARPVGEERCAQDIASGLAQLNRRSADEPAQGDAPPATAAPAPAASIEVEPLLPGDSPSPPSRWRGSDSAPVSRPASSSFCAGLCSCITRWFTLG